MNQLIKLQLPVEVVVALLKSMEAFASACVETREYLESGLCSDSGMLDMETPQEAAWEEDFSRAARSFIVDQLLQQDLAKVVEMAG